MESKDVSNNPKLDWRRVFVPTDGGASRGGAASWERKLDPTLPLVLLSRQSWPKQGFNEEDEKLAD